MTWISALSALMQLALTLLRFLQNRQMIKAGQDEVIAKAALEILENTRTGKELREKIKSLDDDAADKLWDDMTNV